MPPVGPQRPPTGASLPGPAAEAGFPPSPRPGAAGRRPVARAPPCPPAYLADDGGVGLGVAPAAPARHERRRAVGEGGERVGAAERVGRGAGVGRLQQVPPAAAVAAALGGRRAVPLLLRAPAAALGQRGGARAAAPVALGLAAQEDHADEEEGEGDARQAQQQEHAPLEAPELAGPLQRLVEGRHGARGRPPPGPTPRARPAAGRPASE